MFMTFGVVNVGYNQSLTYCPHSGHSASPKKCNVTPSSEEAKKGNVTPSSEEAYVDVVKRDTKKIMIVLILSIIYILELSLVLYILELSQYPCPLSRKKNREEKFYARSVNSMNVCPTLTI